MKRRAPVCTVALWALLSCTSQRTEMMVTVETDLPWGGDGEIRSLTIEVRPGGVLGVGSQRTVWPTPASGVPLRLPMTFSLSPRNQDDAQTLWIEVNGCTGLDGCGAGGAAPVVTERAIVTYVPHVLAELRMFLAGACQGVACRDGETCSPTSRSCVSAQRFVGGAVVDSGLDARMDGGPADERDDATGEKLVEKDVLPQGEPCADGLISCTGRCVSLDTVEDCGGCGVRCDAGGVHTVALCSGGRCRIGCEGTWQDCDGLSSTGCEVDVASDLANCGSCRNPCANDGGAIRCSAGACSVVTCAAGRGDCDMRGDNGCEVDLTSSGLHCGMCGARCDPRNTQPVCRVGRCDYDLCDRGFGDCDGDRTNGCESDSATDGMNCGTCGRRCAFANGESACVRGACSLVRCQAGYGDCDGTAANGCEVALATDTAHCGACGRACSLPNATAACRDGACAVGACAAGFGDCNSRASDGCENDLRSEAHCGRCGNTCASGQWCYRGACTGRFVDTGLGTVVDLSTRLEWQRVGWGANYGGPGDRPQFWCQACRSEQGTSMLPGIGWSQPSSAQLASLREGTTCMPAILSWSGSPSGAYWVTDYSSATCSSPRVYYWSCTGQYCDSNAYNAANCRCVRSWSP